MVIGVLKELNENCHRRKKDIENMNKYQVEIKNAIFEMKNTLEGIKTRLDEAENGIGSLENNMEKNPVRATKWEKT